MANANIRHEVFCFTRYNIQRILLASHNPLDISLLCDSAFEIDRGMLFPFEITKSQNVVE